MRTDLRVGIIGAGGIAKLRHVDAWLSLADRGVRVVAVADIDALRAQTVAGRVGGAQVFTDYRDLLALDEIDAVDIITPTGVHKEQSVAALEAGKHVICEKPMCMDEAEGQAIIEAAGRTGKKFMVTQHHRFPLPAQAARRLVESGRLGEVYHVRCHALRRRLLPAAPTFIYKKNSGGGPLLDIGVHILDLAMFLMGFPKPVLVMGSTMTKLAHREDIINEWGDWDRKGIDVEDFAAGIVRFDNGATLVLETSWLLNMDARDDFSLRLFGTEAGLYFPEMVLYSQLDGAIADTKIGGVTDPVFAHTRAIQAFYNCIVSDLPSPVPADQNIDVLRVLWALYQSSQSGREVRL